MPRLRLNDQLLLILRNIMLQDRIYDKPGLRLTTAGILYPMRSGYPWRHFSTEFGGWNTVYKQFKSLPQ